MYSYKLTADNSTISYISLSEFGGGWMKAKAYVEDEGGKQSLVAELENKDTGNVDVILKRTRKKGRIKHERCVGQLRIILLT